MIKKLWKGCAKIIGNVFMIMSCLAIISMGIIYLWNLIEEHKSNF